MNVEPHAYIPDYQAMGDCAVCGHVQESPLHIRPIRIEIPNKPEPTHAEKLAAAAQILVNTIREAGLSPRRFYAHPLAADLVREWVFGRTDRAGFVHSCRILAILNPDLLGGGK
jgi:hypothetical protein